MASPAKRTIPPYFPSPEPYAVCFDAPVSGCEMSAEAIGAQSRAPSPRVSEMIEKSCERREGSSAGGNRNKVRIGFRRSRRETAVDDPQTYTGDAPMKPLMMAEYKDVQPPEQRPMTIAKTTSGAKVVAARWACLFSQGFRPQTGTDGRQETHM